MDARRHPVASFGPRRLEAAVRAGGVPTLTDEDGVVLFADVSGFTRLADELGGGSEGVDAVQRTLSRGFSLLIDAVDHHGGDVIGFAGDAMTAWWPESPDAVVRATAAALEGVRSLEQANDTIAMRMGIGTGRVHMWSLGDPGHQRLATTSGPAVRRAASAQTLATPGAVLVAASTPRDDRIILEREGDDQPGRVIGVDAPEPAAPRIRTEPAGADLEVLSTYLPVSVQHGLDAGQGRFMSELRFVTSVFVAVPGFGEGDVEATAAVVAGVQALVARFGGALNKISVDEKGAALLVVFGAPPLAHEDDADRAVSTAMGIDEFLESHEVAHGIGVASGMAFCGAIGNDLRQEFTVIGDVVNLSARLATAGVEHGADTVYCDDSTAQEAGDVWTFTIPQSLRLKGKPELLTARQPLERVGRTAAPYTAMVGRSADLAWLRDHLVEAGGDGTGSAVLMVSGEAGIGKSQLLAALGARAGELALRPVYGFADPVSSALAYHPWIQVLRDLVGPVSTAEELAEALGDELRPEAALLEFAMPFEVPATAATAGLSDDERIRHTRRMLLELLRRRAHEEPLLVMLEDGHWFDSGSWGLIEGARAIPRLGLVVTSRPLEDRVPELERLRANGRLLVRELEPLDQQETAALLREALHVDEVDDELVQAVHDRCGGNPFFIIEVAAALHRGGVVRIEAGRAGLHEGASLDEDLLPHTIQAAITSRIDQLGAAEQLTAKVASVIGTRFHTSTLSAVHPVARDPGELRRQLDSLVDHEVLVRDDPSGGRHAFKHALTCEAAYHLLLSGQRQQLHQRLAEYLESGQSELEPLHEELGLHWLRAGFEHKAAHYFQLASVVALSSGLPKEAVDLGVRAARLLAIELETDPARIQASIATELAEIDRLMAGRSPLDLVQLPQLDDEQVAAGIGTLLQAMPAAFMSLQAELFALMAIRNLNLTLRFGASTFASGVYSMYSIVHRALTGDYATAYDFSELARVVDERNGDILAPSVAFVHCWFNNHWRNPIAACIPIAEQGAERGLAGQDLLYGCFNLAAAAVFAARSGETVPAVIERAVAAADRIADRVASAAFHARLEAQVAKALLGATASPTDLGDEWCPEEQLAAITETTSYNQIAYFLIAKLRLHTMAGTPREGLAYGRQATALLPSFAGQPEEVEWVTWMALAEMDEGAAADVGDALTESVRTRLAQLDEWRRVCPANFAHKHALVAAELAARDGDAAAAAALFTAAAASAIEHGYVNDAAVAKERHGRWLARIGRFAAASTAFEEAAALYERWGAARKVAEIRALAGGTSPAT